ncbi:MAG: response regulator [Casimicrobiaceae bacterium]
MSTMLLVDDDSAMLESIANLLMPLGWDLVRCSNGDDAARVARARPLDLVLSDVVMEGLVGTALLDAIHASPVNAATPVVFMSSMPEERVRALIEGDFGFIQKPVEVRRLRSIIEAALPLERGALAARPGAGRLLQRRGRHPGL